MSAPSASRRTNTNPSDTSSHERDEALALERSKPPSRHKHEPHARRERSAKQQQRSSSARPSTLKNWQRVLLAVLFFCGPIRAPRP